MKGKLIVIDGCDGAGKTTVIESLKKILPKEKFSFTKEPGGTIFADKIRKLILSDEAKQTNPLTMFCLFWASRSEHLKNKIIPRISAGENVITDRFDSATYAYQIFGEKKRNWEKIFWEIRKLTLQSFKPDLYIFLDLPVEETLRRISERGGKQTHFDKRAGDYHRRVRAGLKKFAKQVPAVIIDATASKEKVLADVLETLDRKTKHRLF